MAAALGLLAVLPLPQAPAVGSGVGWPGTPAAALAQTPASGRQQRTGRVRRGESAAAERPAVGRLRFVVSPPDARITVDEREVGRRSVEVALGVHTVRIEAPGRRPMTAEPFIDQPGRVVTVRANLPADPDLGRGLASQGRGVIVVSDRPPAPPPGDGALNVTSEPAATVLLDGDSVGVTPLRGYRLPAGQYFVRVVRTGWADGERLTTVSRGGDTSLDFTLRRPTKP